MSGVCNEEWLKPVLLSTVLCVNFKEDLSQIVHINHSLLEQSGKKDHFCYCAKHSTNKLTNNAPSTLSYIVQHQLPGNYFTCVVQGWYILTVSGYDIWFLGSFLDFFLSCNLEILSSHLFFNAASIDKYECSYWTCN